MYYLVSLDNTNHAIQIREINQRRRQTRSKKSQQRLKRWSPVYYSRNLRYS